MHCIHGPTSQQNGFDKMAPENATTHKEKHENMHNC
jgi:hypothetical protein